MKKRVLAAAALFAVCLPAGCGSKPEEQSSGVPSENPTEAAATEAAPIIDPEGHTLEEKPTEREREIEAFTDFEFEVINGGAVITKYSGNAEEVVIPSELGGAPVTELGYYAFEAKWDLKSVTIPDTVTGIGEFCFSDCSSLVSVTLPESLTYLDRGAFAACTSLPELNVPAGVSVIHEEAFTACEAMTSLTIGSSTVKYENWGLEALPDLTLYVAEGSELAQWAQGSGINYAIV